MICLEEKIAADLLSYAMKDIHWDFDLLTEVEKMIVGTPEKLAELKKWAHERVRPICDY